MLEEQRGADEAEKLLEELSFNALPIIPDDVAASIDCEQFRLVVEEREFNSEGILGKAEGNSKGALVYVNAKIPDERRKNFTTAHELGHVCMHIMHQKRLSFECGKKEIYYNQFDDPIEKEANGFASGLLMPKRLISPHFNGDVTWQNIHHLSVICDASLEATYRRLSGLDCSPTALIIHENGTFKRFVPSNFDFFIERSPLSSDQQTLAVDIKEEEYPSTYETVDASDWINPRSRGLCLESIYASTILLNDGFSYTILTYDDDCILENSRYY